MVFIKDSSTQGDKITVPGALRHLLMFQIKLAFDALRDFVFSPLSVLVFIIDVLRRPRAEDSLYLRLMMWGRRSDRAINLFDEYRDAGAFTVDEAVDELEQKLRAAKQRQADRTPDQS